MSSGNPIYTLIINGFAGFYEEMAKVYFAQPEARAASSRFYLALLESAEQGDPQAAERITRQVMEDSIVYWFKTGQFSTGQTG